MVRNIEEEAFPAANNLQTVFCKNVFADGLEPGLPIQIAWPIDSRKW